jgi:hypothetical protein
MHGILAGLGIRYTLFFRADQQIRDSRGTFLALYHEHRTFVDRLLADGCELGWHPHLYRSADGRQEPIRDPEEACRALEEAFEEVQREPSLCRAVRLGEAWHSTGTMRLLDRLGFRIDSTAIAGRARNDEHLRFDWLPTPNRPYHPSAADYRVEGSGDALRILEIPMTSAPVLTSYDVAPLRRYVNLCYQPRLFSSALAHVLSEVSEGALSSLVLIFHPHELLDHPANGLYLYGLENFRLNLGTLVSALEKSGRDVAFSPLSAALP